MIELLRFVYFWFNNELYYVKNFKIRMVLLVVFQNKVVFVLDDEVGVFEDFLLDVIFGNI